jgi:hypothetical protein
LNDETNGIAATWLREFSFGTAESYLDSVLHECWAYDPIYSHFGICWVVGVLGRRSRRSLGRKTKKDVEANLKNPAHLFRALHVKYIPVAADEGISF